MRDFFGAVSKSLSGKLHSDSRVKIIGFLRQSSIPPVYVCTPLWCVDALPGNGIVYTNIVNERMSPFPSYLLRGIFKMIAVQCRESLVSTRLRGSKDCNVYINLCNTMIVCLFFVPAIDQKHWPILMMIRRPRKPFTMNYDLKFVRNYSHGIWAFLYLLLVNLYF